MIQNKNPPFIWARDFLKPLPEREALAYFLFLAAFLAFLAFLAAFFLVAIVFSFYLFL